MKFNYCELIFFLSAQVAAFFAFVFIALLFPFSLFITVPLFIAWTACGIDLLKE